MSKLINEILADGKATVEEALKLRIDSKYQEAADLLSSFIQGHSK